MAKNEIDLEKMEQDITAALLEAASYRANQETATVRIKRNDKLLFTFEVRGLDEDEWAKCRRQNLSNRGLRTEELNNARFLSQVIYEATADADKERVWKNKAVWQKLNVASGVDLINAILLPGEKNSIVDAVIKLSGYEDDTEDLIKK